MFPLYGKLPKQGLDILFKAKDSLDENNPVSTEKLPLRRTRVKSDLKELTNQLMKACEPTPEQYSSVKKQLLTPHSGLPSINSPFHSKNTFLFNSS